MHAARLANDHAATAPVPFAKRGDLDSRLSRLLAAEAEAERRARLFRSTREEREMLMMRQPVNTGDAYALFGLLLGTLPPAAIFYQMFGYGIVSGSTYGLGRNWDGLTLFALCLAMNAVCALVGRLMGRALGQTVIAPAGRRSLAVSLLASLLTAFVWGVGTGAAGGALFFLIGAIFGATTALAVALPAFAVFTLFHHTLARGGMIDACHLRPLAWAVAGTAAALILSPSSLTF